MVHADASDNTGVERVEFYVDGELVFTDYSPPYEFVLDSGKYDNGEHGLSGKAFDLAGESSSDDMAVGVANVRDKTAPTVIITYPQENDTVSGKVSVKANLSDDTGLAQCFFRVDGNFEGFEGFQSYPKNKTVTFEWDTRFVTDGKYRLAVEAYDKDGKYGFDTCDVVVSQPPPTPVPKLKVTKHKVTRNKNFFKVTLTVANVGGADARNVIVQDFLRSFQPIEGYTYFANVEARFTPSTMYGDAVITSIINFAPGVSATYDYIAVPVLVYPNPPTPSIGDTVKLWYEDANGVEYSEEIKSPVVQTTNGEALYTSYLNALNTADYLLVTNPQRLVWWNNSADTDALLCSMAELARYKSGVLGYLDVYDSNTFRNLIKQGGDWSSKLINGWDSSGYLLIVGEVEIVPSWVRAVATVLTTHGDKTWKPLTDYPYASTYGDDLKPELSMGRIIGNNAKELRKLIDTSLNVYLQTTGYGFDWSDMLLASGYSCSMGGGSDCMDFKGQVNTVSSELSKKNPSGVQSKIHTPDYTQYSPKTGKIDIDYSKMVIQSVFFTVTKNRDIIFLAGHGNAWGWDAIGAGNVTPQANPFGSTNPFIFVSSCLAGTYYDFHNPTSKLFGIAEAFLSKGAGAYLGATDSGGWDSQSKRFFEKWDKGEAVGAGVKQTKRSLGGGDLDRIWSAIYHLYGDPKYGMFITLLPGSGGSTSSQSQPASSSVVTIPGYEVTQVEGMDYVEIPGGGVLFEVGKPLVPYFQVFYDYPAGYQIQDVVMTGVSQPTATTGLKIPSPDFVPLAGNEPSLTVSNTSITGWYPYEAFEWTVFESPDTTTLAVTIYPFYYNTQTTEAKFYESFSFDIKYTVSEVEINKLATDKDVYEPGEQVAVDFELKNAGTAAKDVVVSTAIKEESSGDVVSSLPLRTLKSLLGKASYSTTWNSSGFEPGYYIVNAELKDVQGNLLDSKTGSFRIGVSLGEITEFAATPEQFNSGDGVRVSVTFNNLGQTSLSGIALIRVEDKSGEIVQEFAHEFTDLAPSQVVTFDDIWDTSDVKEGAFTINGFVLYDGKSTDLVTVAVNAAEETGQAGRPWLWVGIGIGAVILLLAIIVLRFFRAKG
ncbi:MAG: hypothetical protein A2Z75_01935 [Chloroflexi bacterium RBG_13_50_10]|nr:MAG: hypothetical protein A2Z75_01935 [Chloroflexi bacterium RBG_13_50_10]